MLRTPIMLICLTGLLLTGCQGPGVDQTNVDEVKEQIGEIREYIAELNTYHDSVLAVQAKIFKLHWRLRPEEMERIFGAPTKDTFPFPKPPPPPPYPMER